MEKGNINRIILKINNDYVVVDKANRTWAWARTPFAEEETDYLDALLEGKLKKEA